MGRLSIPRRLLPRPRALPSAGPPRAARSCSSTHSSSQSVCAPPSQHARRQRANLTANERTASRTPRVCSVVVSSSVEASKPRRRASSSSHSAIARSRSSKMCSRRRFSFSRSASCAYDSFSCGRTRATTRACQSMERHSTHHRQQMMARTHLVCHPAPHVAHDLSRLGRRPPRLELAERLLLHLTIHDERVQWPRHARLLRRFAGRPLRLRRVAVVRR